MSVLKVATLFSGVGTPEQSLKHLNINHETIFACEIDKYARQTYLANNQEPNTFYEDVYNIDGKKYLNQIDIMSRNILDMLFNQIFKYYKITKG